MTQERLNLDTLDIERSRLPSLCESFRAIGLKWWHPPLEGAYHSLCFQLARPTDTGIPFNLRARTYGLADADLMRGDIVLDLKEASVLEIKRRLGDHIQSKRREVKYRQTSTLGQIIFAASSPSNALSILREGKRISLPVGYPNTTIPSEVFVELAELDAGFMPSFLITSVRQHWVVDEDNPDRMRVSIDSGYVYHQVEEVRDGFCKTKKMGSYPYSRVEIKIADETLVNRGEKARLLINESGGFSPLTRADAKRVYYWRLNKFPAQFPLIKRSLSYELEHEGTKYEMEGKISLSPSESPERVRGLLYDCFKKRSSSIDNLRDQVVLPPRDSVTKSRYYAIRTSRGLEQALVVTTNEKRPGWIGIKRKSSPGNDVIQFREEEKEDTPYGVFTPETEDLIISSEEEKLGHELVFVGELTKTKRRIYVENCSSYRSYILSVDTCESNGKFFQQIEVEYGSRQGPVIPIMSASIPEIKQDIERIMEITVMQLNSLGISAEPTSKTKFNWLLELGGLRVV